jgi:type I restriction enzyme S subunit
MIIATDEMVKSQFIEMFGDYEKNPKGWPVGPFDEFARIDAVMTTDYDKYADYPHIGVDSIEKNTGILSGYRTVKEDNVISGKYVFSPKHIIYSKIRPNLNKVALPDFDGVCSADAYPILPIEGKCDRVYLAYLMRSSYFLSYILKFSARSNMPKVNREQIRGFKAPLPPYGRQKEFSDIVKQADKSK